MFWICILTDLIAVQPFVSSRWALQYLNKPRDLFAPRDEVSRKTEWLQPIYHDKYSNVKAEFRHLLWRY